MSSEEKLIKMLKYVSEHNDFYKKRINEYRITDPLDIAQWPILTRKELQKNRYNMFSDGEKEKYFSQQLRRQASSGSTGIPVSVYWDNMDWYASNMCLWRKRLHWYGIKPNDKQVLFDLDGFSQPAGCGLRFLNNPFFILNFCVSTPMKAENYKEMIERINIFEPKWIRARPYVLSVLMNYCIFFKINPPRSIRIIETYGEKLDNYSKKTFSRFFGIPIIDMYGSEELNCISYENTRGESEVLIENVYVEVLNNGKIYKYGSGESIITSLLNRSMPLIRYDQGDQIEVNYSDVSNREIIKTVLGRTIDCVFENNKMVINQTVLLEVMGEINNYFGQIVKYFKFKYFKSIKTLECELKIDEQYSHWNDRVEKEIIRVLTTRLPFDMGIYYKVRFVLDPPVVKNKNKIIEVLE